MAIQKLTDSMRTTVALDGTKLTGPLPAISGASLTNLPASGKTVTERTSDPTISDPATPTQGDLILRKDTGEMWCCTTVSSGANVWTNIGDGIGTIEPWNALVGSGGTANPAGVTAGDYKVHTFTAGGTFTVTTLGHGKIDYLVIGGGGGGAVADDGGGGGGAGGYRHAVDLAVTATAYTILVGNGGAGGLGSNREHTGTNGDPSSIAGSGLTTISAAGGGGGGSYGSASAPGGPALDGGSGGGAADNTAGSEGSGNTPTVLPSQGNDGGYGGQYTGGGGGGAGAAGGIGTAGTGGTTGKGGNGSSASVIDSTVRAGGGESGGHQSNSRGGVGTGGGGAGGLGTGNGSAGTINTGSGGGGAGREPGVSNGNSAAGGSGIVIIRYRFQNP